MSRKVRALIFGGHEVERARVIHEGANLFHKPTNRRWAIKGGPILGRRPWVFGGSADTYLCSAETATTFDPPRDTSAATINGKEYQITPEFLAELLDNRDLAALNQASKPTPVLLLLLAAGAGAAAMVILQMVLKATSHGGG